MSDGRLGRRGLFGGGLGAFATILIVAYQVIRLLAPHPAPPPCAPGGPCGAPPQGSALAEQTTWRSGALGFAFDYDPNLWTVDSQSAHAVVLRSNETGSPFFVWVDAVGASGARPEDLVATRVQDLGNTILGLAQDTSARGQILGPAIGYLPGVGARYDGQVDTPQGPGGRVAVAVMAATDGRITAVVSVVTDAAASRRAFAQADSMLNTFLWPSETP